MKLPEREAGVFLEITGRLPLEESIALKEFRASGRHRQFVAGGALAAHPDVKVVFTLGSLSDHLFMTATDGDVEHVAQVLADIEGYDAFKARIISGGTVPMEDAYLKSHGRVASLFLRPAVSRVLKAVGDSLEVGDSRFHCLLVAFLNSAEYESKLTTGFDALINEFKKTRRDLVRITG